MNVNILVEDLVTKHNKFKAYKITVDHKFIKSLYCAVNWPEGISIKRFFEPISTRETHLLTRINNEEAQVTTAIQIQTTLDSNEFGNN